ncbi:unnamed protein product [Euphydryas editha]|uniref:Uncharacterized protein n=1 Tax=Euphydryas editha TaxID=104508 RepID=A0AAU9UP02_EUPED|nr:unnamed protein product [Euphydryas editha]
MLLFQNDTASISISVQNVNEWEPRFKHAHYEFVMRDAREPLGRLTAYDGDRGERVRLRLAGPGAEALEVRESGELFVRAGALAALNASELHVVATAVDSGEPPRQTSVPVVVRFPASPSTHTARAHASPLFAAFACALALLALLLLALLTYLCRLKRRRQVKDTSPVKPPTPDKPACPSAAPSAGGGSLASVSAGASSILAASSTSLDLPRAPEPAAAEGTLRQSRRTASPERAAGALSDHLQGAAGRSGVAWPSATIPARVKHLSWDDAAQVSTDRRTASPERAAGALSDHLQGAAGRSGVAWPSATIPARVKHLSWDDAAQVSTDRRTASPERAAGALSDHLQGAAGRSGVAWPSATIPARVKHLSWDDAAQVSTDRRTASPERAAGALSDHLQGAAGRSGVAWPSATIPARVKHLSWDDAAQVSTDRRTASPERAAGALSDHLQGAAGRSGVAWPSATIPARVKHLSWDDAAQVSTDRRTASPERAAGALSDHLQGAAGRSGVAWPSATIPARVKHLSWDDAAQVSTDRRTASPERAAGALSDHLQGAAGRSGVAWPSATIPARVKHLSWDDAAQVSTDRRTASPERAAGALSDHLQGAAGRSGVAWPSATIPARVKHLSWDDAAQVSTDRRTASPERAAGALSDHLQGAAGRSGVAWPSATIPARVKHLSWDDAAQVSTDRRTASPERAAGALSDHLQGAAGRSGVAWPSATIPARVKHLSWDDAAQVSTDRRTASPERAAGALSDHLQGAAGRSGVAWPSATIPARVKHLSWDDAAQVSTDRRTASPERAAGALSDHLQGAAGRSGVAWPSATIPARVKHLSWDDAAQVSTDRRTASPERAAGALSDHLQGAAGRSGVAWPSATIPARVKHLSWDDAAQVSTDRRTASPERAAGALSDHLQGAAGRSGVAWPSATIPARVKHLSWDDAAQVSTDRRTASPERAAGALSDHLQGAAGRSGVAWPSATIPARVKHLSWDDAAQVSTDRRTASPERAAGALSDHLQGAAGRSGVAWPSATIPARVKHLSWDDAAQVSTDRRTASPERAAGALSDHLQGAAGRSGVAWPSATIPARVKHLSWDDAAQVSTDRRTASPERAAGALSDHLQGAAGRSGVAWPSATIPARVKHLSWDDAAQVSTDRRTASPERAAGALSDHLQGAAGRSGVAWPSATIPARVKHLSWDDAAQVSTDRRTASPERAAGALSDHLQGAAGRSGVAWPSATIPARVKHLSWDDAAQVSTDRRTASPERAAGALSDHLQGAAGRSGVAWPSATIPARVKHLSWDDAAQVSTDRRTASPERAAGALSDHLQGAAGRSGVAWPSATIPARVKHLSWDDAAQVSTDRRTASPERAAGALSDHLQGAAGRSGVAWPSATIPARVKHLSWDDAAQVSTDRRTASPERAAGALSDHLQGAAGRSGVAWPSATIPARVKHLSWDDAAQVSTDRRTASPERAAGALSDHLQGAAGRSGVAWPSATIPARVKHLSWDDAAQVSTDRRTASPERAAGALSDHLQGAAGRSGVAWPSATIPARVKHLSWDDAAQVSTDRRTASPERAAGALSDHLQGAAGRSGVAWPSATIPARVKHLSWDDAAQVSTDRRTASPERAAGALSDHLQGAAGRSGVAWPSATIPARVKHLSWDDAAQVSTDRRTASPERAAGALSDHLQGAAGRSGVAWPSATIPARVKHLSWDDAAQVSTDRRTASPERAAGALSDHLQGAAGRSGVAWPSATIPARVKHLSWDDAAQVSTDRRTASPERAAGALSDHLQGAAGRSGVAWPSATIPARVKHLSWDDAAQTGDAREVTEATNPAVEHMNLTVYF